MPVFLHTKENWTYLEHQYDNTRHGDLRAMIKENLARPSAVAAFSGRSRVYGTSPMNGALIVECADIRLMATERRLCNP